MLPWKSLLFYVLVGFFTASNGWQLETEYKYRVTGRTLTGLKDISNQFTGTLFRAFCTLKQVNQSMLHLHLEEPEFASVHMNLSGGWDSPIPNKHLKWTPTQLSDNNCLLRMKKGLVDSVIVAGKLSMWEVNTFKAIASALQVNTQGRQIADRHNYHPPDQQVPNFYSTMETTVIGECETEYGISQLPAHILQNSPELAPLPDLAWNGQFLQISKSTDFNNCRQRPSYHFGFQHAAAKEDDYDYVRNFLTQSCISRIVASGDTSDFTIQSSVTTNKMFISPEMNNGKLGLVVSAVNLTILETTKASGTQHWPANPENVGPLIYSYTNAKGTLEKSVNGGEDSGSSCKFNSDTSCEWGSNENLHTIEPRLPLDLDFVGYEGNSAGSTMQIKPSEACLMIAEEIGDHIHDPSNIPLQETFARFSTLCQLLRTMSTDDIESIGKTLYVRAKNGPLSATSAWKAYRDAVAHSGSTPSLAVLQKWLSSKMVNPDEAAELIAILPDVLRSPLEVIQAVHDLAFSSEVKSHHHLNSAAHLALAELAHRSQLTINVTRDIRFMSFSGDFSSRSISKLVSKCVSHYAEALKNAIQEGDGKAAQFFIRILGLYGIPQTLEVYKPFLEGRENASTFQRVSIIMSMDRVATNYGHNVRPVLYKLYKNTREPHAVRSAAVFQLMKTVPSASMLQKMAQFTNDDHSDQVNSAVKSSIQSAAKLQGQRNMKLSRSAQSALKLLTPKNYGAHYSKGFVHSKEDHGLGYATNLNYIGSHDSIFPNTVVSGLESFTGELSLCKNQFQVFVSSMDDLINELCNQFRKSTPRRLIKAASRTKDWSIPKIDEMLNLQPNTGKTLEGSMFMDVAGSKRVFTFDRRSVKHLKTMIQDAHGTLRPGKSFHYTKLHNQPTLTLALPTATGLPFLFMSETNHIISATGRAQLTSAQPINIFSRIKANLKANFTYSSNTISKLGLITPFKQEYYFTAVERTEQLFLPLNVGAEMIPHSTNVTLAFTFFTSKQQQQQRLVYYKTHLYTARRDILELTPKIDTNDTQTIHIGKTHKMQAVVGQESTGLAILTDYSTDKNIIHENVKENDVISLLANARSSKVLRNDEFNLWHSPSLSTAQSISLKFTYGWLNPFDAKYQESANHTTKLESSKHSVVPQNSDESAESTESDEQQPLTASGNNPAEPSSEHHRREEFLQRLSVGTRGIVDVLDMSVEFKGSSKASVVATVAVANGETDDKSKMILYLSHNPAKRSSSTRPSKVCLYAVSKTPFPPLMDFERALEYDTISAVSTQLDFGEKCSSGSHIFAQIAVQKSDAYSDYLRQQPQAQQCKQEAHQVNKVLSSCRNVTSRASIQNQLTASFQYDNLSPEFLNNTHKLYSFFRHYGYSQMDVNVIEPVGQDGQARLEVDLANDQQSLNVSIDVPVATIRFTNVRLNQWVAAVVTPQPSESLAQRLLAVALNGQQNPTCAIDHSFAETFDKKVYPINLGNCWHVMMKYSPEANPDDIKESEADTYHKIAILVRDNRSTQKEVKILFGNDYIVDLRPAGRGVSVQVNKRSVELSGGNPVVISNNEGNIVFSIKLIPSGEVYLESPSYAISGLYDGTRFVLYASNTYRGDVRGLCGTFDGESANDFKTPKQCTLQDPIHFAATYALVDRSCQGPARRNRPIADQAACY